MRKYTLFLSVIVHLAVAVGVFIAPLFADAKLPAVPDARVEWLPAKLAVLPDVPRPATARPPTSLVSEVVPAAAVPTEAPHGLHPDPDVSTPPPLWSDGLASDATGPDFGIGAASVGHRVTPPPPVRLPEPRRPVRPGGGIEQPRKILHVAPVYPTLAIVARKEGVVILEAIIAEDGSVQQVKVLRSVPLLDQASIDAVRQWRFTPTRLNGEAVPVVMTVTVGFELR